MSMYINPAVSGKANVGWLEAVARTYYETPVERALSLGCGGGALELQGTGWIAKKFDGFDASEGAIELATRLAREGKKSKYINYETADLNKKTFDTDKYTNPSFVPRNSVEIISHNGSGNFFPTIEDSINCGIFMQTGDSRCEGYSGRTFKLPLKINMLRDKDVVKRQKYLEHLNERK